MTTVTKSSRHKQARKKRYTHMPSVPAIDFIVLYVSDLEASLAYFTQKLGFGHDPSQNTPNFRNLVDGQSKIGFGLVQSAQGTPKPGSVEMYFKTNDLEGLRSSYLGKGIELTPIENRPFGSIFSVNPPDGLLVTLLSEANQ
jgi:predicted enzyme related to lactoylglutathione lyase